MRKQNDRRELTFLNNKSTNNYEYKTFERNYLSQRLMVKCFVALIVFCCSVGEAFAQTDTKVTINVNNVLIRTALDQLQREAKIHFVYDEENIDSGKRVSLSYTETPLNAVLDDFCKQTSLRYEVKRNLILILPSKAEKTTGKHEPFYMTGVVTDETGEVLLGLPL